MKSFVIYNADAQYVCATIDIPVLTLRPNFIMHVFYFGSIRASGNRFNLLSMKKSHVKRIVFLMLSLTAFFSVEAISQVTYSYWDSNEDADNWGGSGVWNVSNANWNSGSNNGNGISYAWPNTHQSRAYFKGVPGVISVSGTVNASVLEFLDTGFELSGGNVDFPGSTGFGAPVEVEVWTDVLVTVSSILSGNGFKKKHAGTLVLDAPLANLSGTQIIYDGAVRFGVDEALGEGLAIWNGGVLDLNGHDYTMNSLSLGGGSRSVPAVVTTGTGQLTITNSLKYLASVNENGPALVEGNISLLGGVNINVDDNSGLDEELTLNSDIMDASGSSGTLDKSGDGVLVLNGDLTYSGSTNLDDGDILLNGTLAHSDLTVNAGTFFSGSGSITMQSGSPIVVEGLFVSMETEKYSLKLNTLDLVSTSSPVVLLDYSNGEGVFPYVLDDMLTAESFDAGWRLINDVGSGTLLAYLSSPSGGELFWDPNGGASTGLGGSGDWNSTLVNWNTDPDGGASGSAIAWPNTLSVPNAAILSGLGGGISLASDISVGSIRTENNIYTIGGSHDIMFVGDSAGILDIRQYSVWNGVSLSVSSGKGLIKRGAGTLKLNTAASGYSGVTLIEEGVLTKLGDSTLGAIGSGNETIVRLGGVLNLAGTNTYEDIVLDGGTLENTAGNSNSSIYGEIDLIKSSTIRAAAEGRDIAIEGNIYGDKYWEKTGGGTLALNGSVEHINFDIIAGVVGGSGSIVYNVQADDSDLIQVLGSSTVFDISSLHLQLNLLDQPVGEYVIVAYQHASNISGAPFASVSGAAGVNYSIDYDGTAEHPDAIVLIIPPKIWHVKPDGDDGNSGDSYEGAFATIQHASDLAQAGDTVLIHPGVYFEHVQVSHKGRPGKPITFKADQIEEGRVIVTGADESVRNGASWELYDANLGLYRMPWNDKARPTRVLYSWTDLYPYKSLAHLSSFEATDGKWKDGVWIAADIGPQHGFAIEVMDDMQTPSVEEAYLFVRLHNSGTYGSSDPNNHTISISPEYSASLNVTSPEHYNIGVIGNGDAHVILEGLTFETPGLCGVYVEASDVTVRDSWFYGCRSGVGGNAPYSRSDSYYYDSYANRITVEHCYYTQFPAYDDGLETIALSQAVSHPKTPFWQRKDEAGGLPIYAVDYEVGIASLVGQDWVVSYNLVENVFEALSARATSSSDRLLVYGNRFEKILDNIIETEDKSTNLQFFRNVCVDSFSPISWQPLKGDPLPGPAYIYQNLIYSTPAHATAFGFRETAVFKFLPSDDMMPTTVPSPGFIIYNNSVFWPGENAKLIGSHRWGLYGFSFYNNVFMTNYGFFSYNVSNNPSKFDGSDLWTYSHNFIAPVGAAGEGPPPDVAGAGGQQFADYVYIGLNDPASGGFAPLSVNEVEGEAINPVYLLDTHGEIAHAILLNDVGAIQDGDSWQSIPVGPRD